jgi:hypothetical protein
MCNPSSLKFCSCANKMEKTQNYWQLHRPKPDGPLVIIGMLYYSVLKDLLVRNWGREILATLEKADAFDFDYSPEEGDVLTIYIRNPADLVFQDVADVNKGSGKKLAKKVVIQFSYTDNKWRLEPCEDESLSLNHRRLKKGVFC